MKGEVLSVRSYLILLLLSALVGIVSLYAFNKQDILGFGFTPKFTDIASTTEETGVYSSHLIYSSMYFDQSMANNGCIIDEVQREPLYPIALILIKKLGFDYASLVYVQLFFYILSLFIWSVFCKKLLGNQVAGIVLLFALFSTVMPFYVSVLYPFAFQLFFLSIAFWTFTLGLDSRRWFWFVISGVAVGASCYERGMYILLPFFMAALLAFEMRDAKLNLAKQLVFFLIPFFLTISPWLARNTALGVHGMSQVAGYTLGLTYSKALNLPVDNELEQSYVKNITQFGPDGGSLGFIDHQILAGTGSYVEMDKWIAKLITQAIAKQPLEILIKVVRNVAKYPSKLNPLSKFGEHGNQPTSFYHCCATVSAPSLLDVLIFGCGVAGLTVLSLRQYTLAKLGLVFLAFNMIFTTLLVVFDPRYRGIVDFIIYSAAGFYIVHIAQFYMPSLKNKYA